jgi:uncharacterized protein
VKRFVIIIFLTCGLASAAEVIPPRPARHFNDYAGVVSRTTADELDRQLEQFEKQTSNQVLVAIYPKLQTDSSIDDYAVRIAQQWGVGRKQRNNGVVLFVFPNDRRMYISVGYGLEGALPDALAKRIIDEQIAPRFKANDYDGGVRAGVNAIIAATKGEYKGVGPKMDGCAIAFWIFFGIIVILIIMRRIQMRKWRGHMYSGAGRRSYGYSTPWYWGSPGGWGGGGGWSGGGGFGGGGGGFSAGGGSFGGGGAGGSW